MSEYNAAVWTKIPRVAWDHLVQRDGPLANRLPWCLEDILCEPQIHRYVDTSPDALKRFFEALDQDENKVLTVSELAVGFQRTFTDLGLWSDSDEFQAAWGVVYKEFLQHVAYALSWPADQPLVIDLPVFASIITRFKIELMLRETDGPGLARRDTSYSDVHTEHVELQIPDTPMDTSTYAHFRCFNYNPKMLKHEEVGPLNIRPFLLEPRDSRWEMRWIVVDSNDRPSILRLGAKYHFHPLHLEDVLKLERQQSRYYKYAKQTFVVLPLLRCVRRLAGVSPPPSAPSSPNEPAPILLEKSKIAVVATEGTVITFHAPWKPVLNRCGLRAANLIEGSTSGPLTTGRPIAKSRRRLSDIEVSISTRRDAFLTPSLVTDTSKMSQLPVMMGTKKASIWVKAARRSQDIRTAGIEEEGEEEDEAVTALSGAPESVLQATAELLEVEYSSVRQGGASWLLHALTETSINMLGPVVRAYEERLSAYQEELGQGSHVETLKEKLNKPILSLKNDLLWLQKRVKQLKPVIRNMMNEEAQKEKDKTADGDVLYYLQGTDDTLEQLLDSITTMLTVSTNLLEEAKYLKDDARNETLKFFAVITTLFAPLQFTTGYFGMNFSNAETGLSTIPLMTDKRGPLWFWCICLGICVVFIYYVKYKKRWI